MNKQKYANRDEVLADVRNHVTSGVPFDHFRLFYESAERVTDRRLALNRTNASLAAIIAAGLGIVAAWGHDKPNTVFVIALAVIFFVSLLAAAFCRWWWKQVEAYKDLNKAKFAVLKEMATNIVFVGADRPPTCAFDPFFWEWEVAEYDQSLAKFKGELALGSSWSELVVPKAFLAFFLAIAVISLLIAVENAVQFLR